MTLRAPLTIEPAPHVHAGTSVAWIMLHVVIALIPACVFAVYLFGLAALLTLLVATLSCLAAERLLQRGSAFTLADGSALVTGLIYGLTLPPALPLWMVAMGGFVAMAIGKTLFGGLGSNAFNPALVGRVFLQAAFPAAMTGAWLTPLAAERFVTLPEATLTGPFLAPASGSYDALTGPTPLGDWKFAGGETSTFDLALGFTSGSLGETSALLLLLGGLYLVWVKAANWRIPAAILLTVAICASLLHGIDPQRYPSASFMLLSGGLMLGAWFMATDPVASPLSAAGCWIYGLVIGLLVVLIRLCSGQPEGVMYAILLGNALSPHIDRWTQPRAYGAAGGGS
ncbi:MAG: RnfABCDGE type electron transport complex subunit D [Gammaproteobacteria bacterium]|nr:MAG: RnfABCDGE type electron transport complex subunit D [Gammaproteobacteria bacterium]